MIENLHIEDLGVIESADLTLSPGLTALTGETGAGKTMVLTSLGLLLGQRAETSIVRGGTDKTVVEGTFILDPSSRAALRAGQAGAEMDEDALIVSRVVPSQGRSRAYMGGRAVPSSLLGDVGGELVSVHGQADQLRLRSAAAQRSALDSFGGRVHRQRCRSYAQAYRNHLAAQRALAEWNQGALTRTREIAHLRQWIEQIDALDPQPHEDQELAEEAKRLDHAEDLRRAAAEAYDALEGLDETAEAPSVLSLLSQAHRSIDAASSLDPALAPLVTRLAQLSIDAADISSEIRDYLDRLDADPARLTWVRDRIAALGRACREIGGLEEDIADVDALIAFRERCSQRLDDIDGPADTGSELSRRCEQTEAQLQQIGTELTQARHHLARSLEEKVSAELSGLHMAGARLVVELEPLDEPGPTGMETVALLLQSHPGAPALPLGKGASGGELSRMMLALEVVLAESEQEASHEPPATDQSMASSAPPSSAAMPDEAPDGVARQSGTYRRTLIFDEIDAGVGGQAAGEIGRRLAQLARSYQVVVVTHLPQVAAWADRQLVVRKHVAKPQQGEGALPDSGVVTPMTRTDVVEVAGKERERELARMLSGHAESDTAIRHAAELLAEAHVAQSRA